METPLDSTNLAVTGHLRCASYPSAIMPTHLVYSDDLAWNRQMYAVYNDNTQRGTRQPNVQLLASPVYIEVDFLVAALLAEE